MTPLMTITVHLDPVVEVGPFELTWHGMMTAAGLLVGALVAARFARRVGLDPARVSTLVIVAAAAGIAGARLFFLALNDPAALAAPAAWLGTHGFAIYGALLAALIGVGVYLRRASLPVRYLDALAYGFPFGLAVGRIGDVVNGEHFGPPTSQPWGIRWTHPDVLAPSAEVAYHSGGLYEVVLALVIVAVVVPAARRLTMPTDLLWLVLALYGAGRLLMFFWRDDSEAAVLGLHTAQLVSVGFVGLALAGASARRRGGLRLSLGAALGRRPPWSGMRRTHR